jgi:hypothetical protein
MSLLGFNPNLGDFQKDAWEKALWLFPGGADFRVDEWVQEGLIELDLDGTLIGRHLGPEASQIPLWGTRRSLGFASEGLVIPYGDPASEQALQPIQIPWIKIRPAYDSTHFEVISNVIVTLHLNEEASTKVAKWIGAIHV